jgi:glyceraldehyde-3-phosphate dehydrogenase (ferredoxin)
MELIAKGLVDPEKFDLPPASGMNFNFASQPDAFDVVADSARNAKYATQVITMMVFEPAGEPFRLGIRHAAQILDKLFSHAPSSPSSSAVFISHGMQGSMTPNQYWVPGMLAPMPMMGKYFVYYGLDYQSPRILGRKCVERMVFELFSENTGVCRFHRKWVENIVDEIIQAHYKIDIDYKAHQFELALQIYDLDGSAVRFWESERTIDIIWQYLEKWERFGLNDDSLHQWVQRFRQDKWTAARAYWQEIRSGIAEAFAVGRNSIPDTVAPYQAASMDVMVKKGK